MEAIIAEREADGPFRSIEDLCRRLDLQKVNRRVLEALIRSGSLDCLGTNRATLHAPPAAAMQLGDQNSKAQEAGQNDMFGLAAAARPQQAGGAGREHPDGAKGSVFTGERETLGLYLTGHPIVASSRDSHALRLPSHRRSDQRSADMETALRGGKPVTVAGLIDEVKKRGPRTILRLDDRTGRLEVTLFEEVFQKYRDLVVKDALVLVEGLSGSTSSVTPGACAAGG